MRAKALGLIAAGKFTDSPACRLLTGSGQLGPVKAPSMRVASRIANTLRAGYPVSQYQDLEQCRLIIVRVPDRAAASTVAELARQRLTWSQKAVVVCSALITCEELAPLAAVGVDAGCLTVIPGFDERWLLLEGTKPLELQLGKFMDLRARRVTAIRPGLKPLFLAALECTGSMMIPMLIAASESLRRSGFSSAQASAIVQKQVENSMRAYAKAGRRAYREIGDAADLGRRVESEDAQLARYLEASARAAKLVVRSVGF